MNKGAEETNRQDPPGPRQHFDEQVYRIVRSIPEGRVMTYGQVAALISTPVGIDPLAYRRIRARWVGYALSNCPEDVPWQRVINQKGEASRRTSGGHRLQDALLEAEGTAMKGPGLVDLAEAQWHPDEEFPHSTHDNKSPSESSNEKESRP